MVDEKILAYGRAGVNVNARAGVGHFGNDAGNHRHVKPVEHMGDAVMQHGVHGGIAENGLAGAGGRRVALVGGLGVARQQAADLRQALHEIQSLGRTFVFTGSAGLGRLPALAGKTEAARDLLAQQVVDGIQIGRKVIAHGLAPDPGWAEISRKNGRAQALHYFPQRVQRRHGRALGRAVPDNIQRGGMAEALHHRIQFRHGHGLVVICFAHGAYPVVFPFVHGLWPARNGFAATGQDRGILWHLSIKNVNFQRLFT